MRGVIVFLVCVLIAAKADAASIRARLIRASNESTVIDDKLSDIGPKLKKVFGYQGYQQIGEQKQVLQENGNLKMNLGEGFVVFVTPKSVAKEPYEVEVELTSGRTAILKPQIYKMVEKKPVLIRGPEVGSTLIIVALTVGD
jgi:hypothetical protein